MRAYEGVSSTLIDAWQCMEMGGQLHAQAAASWGKSPSTHNEQEAGYVPASLSLLSRQKLLPLAGVKPRFHVHPPIA